MELIRSFIAVEIEDPAVLKKLIEVRNRFVATGAELKPVEDENIHLTLRFLGEIPEETVKKVAEILEKLNKPGFKIRVAGVGAFPTPHNPRVIWAGVSEGAENIVEIYRAIEKEVRKLGIPAEREEFVPHITLARVKGRRGLASVTRLILELEKHDFGETPVTRICLKKSVLTPRGPIYSDLYVKKL